MLIGSKAAIEANSNVRLSRDAGDVAQGRTPPCEGCPMDSPLCRGRGGARGAWNGARRQARDAKKGEAAQYVRP